MANPKAKRMTDQEIYEKSTICDMHFSEHCRDPSNELSLKEASLPTLHVPGNKKLLNNKRNYYKILSFPRIQG